MTKVLIVDDDNDLRTKLSGIMVRAGYEVAAAAAGKDAIEMAINEDFDVVLLDLIMPKMSGADVLTDLRRVSPRSRIIMISAFATMENVVDAIKHGASDYVFKPFKIPDLLTRVRRTIEERRIDLCAPQGDLECILSSLSNPTRRAIMLLLSQIGTMRLMEIVRELGFDDHMKVIFHLKILKEAKLIEQGAQKSYSLTSEGTRALEGLKVLEKYLH